MNTKGFTLVELIVVIALFAILAAVATMNFRSMSQKAQVDRQMLEIHNDIVSFRIESMQQKRRSAIFIGQNQLNFRSYPTNEEVATNATGTLLRTKTFTVPIQRLTGGGPVAFDINADRIEFDTRGYTNNNMTIVAEPQEFNTMDNCIIINVVRTNLGRMTNATTCTAR